MKRIDPMTTRHAKPPVVRLTAILLLGSLWLGWGIGCRKTESPDSNESRPPGCVEIPIPELSKLDRAVRKQLRDKQLALEALRKRPEASDVQLGQMYGEMGMLYHAYELYDAAEACYQNARVLSPGAFHWPYYIGKLRAIQGDSDGAAAAFKQALSIKTDDVPALINLAQIHLKENRPDDAKPYFERALAQSPSCAAAHLGLGKTAALQGDHESAVQHCLSALRLQPDATAVHYVLAMSYRQLKKMKLAAEHLRKCTYTDVGVADPLRISDPWIAAVNALPVGRQRQVKTAREAIKAGNLDLALAELSKAVKANPDDPVARLNLGIVLARRGDLDGAILEYREAIRLNPKFAPGHRELAAMLANKKQYDEAQKHFLQAVACDPELFDAHWGLAKLAMLRGQHQLADTHFARAVKIAPRNAEAREGHIIALTKAGRYADAVKSLQESRKILPRSMVLAHAAARLLATCPEDRLRNGAVALKLATTVFRTYQCIEHAETLAMAFAETGNYDQAKQWQNNAIKVATDQKRSDAIGRLKKNLELYESGKPCRTPW